MINTHKKLIEKVLEERLSKEELYKRVVCEAREEGVSFEETIGVSKGKENTGSEGMFGRKKLKDYKTEEIVKELVKRYGVSVMKVRAGCQYQVKGNGSRVKEEGPATVLVVRG